MASFKYRIFFIVMLISVLFFQCQYKIDNYSDKNRKALTFPNYDSIFIPVNIAPLNFIIKEKADGYFVDIKGKLEDSRIIIHQKSPLIKINEKKWKKLLKENEGSKITVSIFTKENGSWFRYNDNEISIAKDSIDPFLAYRLVHAVYLFWYKMGIYQRSLESFDETTLYENEDGDYNCVNCHSFSKNNPSKMLMHFRIKHSGTLIYDNGSLKKLNTKTPYTMSGGVYPAWHPDGRHIAFAVVKLSPHLTTRTDKIMEVADKASDIVVLDTKRNLITTSPLISTKNRENIPAWSPDGKYLYYISAPKSVKNNKDSLLRVLYSLVRIEFNSETSSFGKVDTVLSSQKTGFSITFPLISPDGKYLLFTAADHGYFSIYNSTSDLYMLDLNTNQYRNLSEINSNTTESYHSWSSNGRWIIFSSKRLDQVFSRPFIAYFDKNGKIYKPFLLPQKDPEKYTVLLASFNRPEFITGPIQLSRTEIRDLVHSKAEDVTFDPNVEIDALSAATKIVSPKK